MFMSYIFMSGFITLMTRGLSIFSFFFSLEIIFFFFIFYSGIHSSGIFFFCVVSIIVGMAVLSLTLLVSTMSFMGSDNQTSFLD